MKRILIVFGTRPEAIKMFPVVKAFKENPDFDTKVCSTGQHKEMLADVLNTFGIELDYEFDIMKVQQDLSYITEMILNKMNSLFKKENFDLVLVHGDTTTAYATSLAAFYNRIPIGHVEAGLRTNNIWSPYPEEFNRKSIDILSSIYFSPTSCAKKNLLQEGINEKHIFVTGNTAIDALRFTIKSDYQHKELEWCKDSRLILLTSHRRENIGNSMRNMFSAVRKVCEERSDVKVIYPVHMNPKVREIANEILGDCSSIHLIDPLNVFDFHNFMSVSYLILTDSGGIQEEAPALGKPVLVMRETTERPEGVEAGTLKMVGTDEATIYNNINMLLDNKDEYLKMSEADNPYGDGYAAERIVKIVGKVL